MSPEDTSRPSALGDYGGVSPDRSRVEVMFRDEAGVGDLVMIRSKWTTLAPTHCCQGHELRPGKVLVGHMACHGHGGVVTPSGSMGPVRRPRNPSTDHRLPSTALCSTDRRCSGSASVLLLLQLDEASEETPDLDEI